MPTSPNDAIKGAFSDLSKQVETLVNQSLKPALTPRKIKSVDMKTAIYTTVHGGLVVHGSIPLPKDTTLKDLRARVHPVGVLLPTVPLRDPVTRNSIAPGAYLVELRPIVDNAFAFDLIDGGKSDRLLHAGYADRSPPAREVPTDGTDQRGPVQPHRRERLRSLSSG